MGKGKGIFPPGSHEHVPGCVSIISLFFFSFCQPNFLLGFSYFFAYEFSLKEAIRALIVNSSLLLQVSTLGLNLLLLPHPDVRSTSSFLPVVSRNSERRIIYRQQDSFVSSNTIKLCQINSTDKLPPCNKRQCF